MVEMKEEECLLSYLSIAEASITSPFFFSEQNESHSHLIHSLLSHAWLVNVCPQGSFASPWRAKVGKK
jgi:hypothetical protein